MTDPIVRLESAQLSVEPGGQGRTLVTVRNLGTIVEGFRLEVLGEGVSEWAEVTPAEVQVYPEQEATAVVVFSPPAGNTTRSGTFPFAVRAESVVDADTSSVAEGDLDIGRVFGLQSKITPVTSSGRWRGKHSLEITNWGNAPVRLKLAAMDPDGRLAFLIGPETLDLPLGVTGHAQLRVRTLKPFLRGAQVRLPFHVIAQPEQAPVSTGPPSLIPNPERATLDGAFVQRSILSKLTVAIAAVAVIAVAGLAAFTLTRGSAAEQAGLAQGPLQKPTLSAASNDATSVQLLWEPQPGVESYEITQLTATGDVTGAIPVNGALNVSEVKDLDPETQYCFQLTALRGDQKSQQSDKACATTAVAPAVPAPSSAEASVSADPTAAPPSSPAVEPSAAAQSGGADGQSTPGGAVVAAPDGQSGPPASTAVERRSVERRSVERRRIWGDEPTRRGSGLRSEPVHQRRVHLPSQRRAGARPGRGPASAVHREKRPSVGLADHRLSEVGTDQGPRPGGLLPRLCRSVCQPAGGSVQVPGPAGTGRHLPSRAAQPGRLIRYVCQGVGARPRPILPDHE